MIRIPSYIQLSRHGIWFFRIVVPKHLRKALDGRGEIKRSLGTRDMRLALRAARPLALDAYELFARLGAPLSRPPTAEEILANADKLRELKATSTVTHGGFTHTYSIETDSNDPAEIAAFEAMEQRKQADQQAKLARYMEKPVAVPEAMADYQRRQDEELTRFKAELAAKADAGGLARPQGEVEEGVPAFRPSPDNVMSKRWAEYVSQSSGNNWDGKRTTPESEKKAAAFMAWWGADQDIRFITRQVVNRFIVHLQTERPLEAGARKGELGLNVRTIDNYTSVLNAFLTWAQKKGYFPDARRLPTEGQALMKRAARTRRKDKANPAYTPAQLIALFAPDAYKFKLAHHFWPPLIALFSGARRREIAQLLTTDFLTVDGIPAFSINIDEDEDKSVKTQAAKRIIPVHPELIAIGLLDYVEDVRSQKLGPELFPGIGTNQHDEKGNAVGNAWRRHRQKLGVDGPMAPTFHSFRSTALKVLKARGVPFEMRCQLAGHDLDHVSQNYDDTPISVKDLMEKGIPNYRYDGLDLSNIRYVRCQFAMANESGAKKVALSEKKIAARKNSAASSKASRAKAARA